ncbi:MAG: zinc-ribbon domain-containing protein [Eubacteriales bacterium]
MTLAEYFQTNPELEREWDREANAQISVDTVSYGTHKKASWRCSQGHKWEANINSRVSSKRGCPYCAGKAVLAGYNDLTTVNKEVLKFWDYEKNTDISPTEVAEFSKKSVWWKCELGHSWKQSIQVMTSSATKGSGCPVCDSKVVLKGFNDLAFLRPDVAKEWCYELNRLKPDEVSAGSKSKAWWKCELGHTWEAYIHARTGAGESKCPYCAKKRAWEGFNDLKTVNPHLASEWDDKLNGDLKPTQVTKGAHKKVWWKCSAGHVWQAYVYARSKENGTGCPVCAGVTRKPKDFYLDTDNSAVRRLYKSI